jgi:hypothetical protein
MTQKFAWLLFDTFSLGMGGEDGGELANSCQGRTLWFSSTQVFATIRWQEKNWVDENWHMIGHSMLDGLR